MKYLLNTINTYRVDTEQDALKLRDKLTEMNYGELVSFSYTSKVTKDDSYYVIKAKIQINKEKDPETSVDLYYGAYDPFEDKETAEEN